MSYSEEADLLTGDIGISDNVDLQKVVDDAAEEIDSKIGFVYALPLPFASLPLHQKLLLKQINNKLASGRLILQLSIGGEDTALHAYGLRMVTEAREELMLVANGQVDLDAPRVSTPSNSDGSPLIHNSDEESAVDIFEAHVHRGEPSYWRPGAVTAPYGYGAGPRYGGG